MVPLIDLKFASLATRFSNIEADAVGVMQGSISDNLLLVDKPRLGISIHKQPDHVVSLQERSVGAEPAMDHTVF